MNTSLTLGYGSLSKYDSKFRTNKIKVQLAWLYTIKNPWQRTVDTKSKTNDKLREKYLQCIPWTKRLLPLCKELLKIEEKTMQEPNIIMGKQTKRENSHTHTHTHTYTHTLPALSTERIKVQWYPSSDERDIVPWSFGL